MTEPEIDKDTEHFDVLIIGGGINGAGIARDATGRGYSVCLCEASDIGGATSSASTKLIHGGLRYLEHYEFRLVRESLMERETLWKMAPHIIWPMRFVLPHHKGLRPMWLLRLGLFLYDHIGGRKLLPPTQTLDLTRDKAGEALKSEYRRGFEYSDCWVEDSRLVVLNARDAADRGAEILPRTKAVKAERHGEKWQVTLEHSTTGRQRTVTASAIVNTGGPWVDEILRTVFGRNDAHHVRLVRGSHIVINKNFTHDRAYIFQNSDARIIFAIPYQEDFTLIGTTDAEHEALDGPPKISGSEIDYLCANASDYFAEPVKRDDIVWTYSGVRPLFDDGASSAQEATRDYVIRQEGGGETGALINIFGGKITTYRRLAEHAMEHIEKALGKRGARWTFGATLPGGDFSPGDYGKLVDDFYREFPFLDKSIIRGLVRRYGTSTAKLLGGAKNLKDLGTDFGHGLLQAEVDYLIANEWAEEADDILFHRTRIGIRFSKKQQAELAAYMKKAAEA